MEGEGKCQEIWEQCWNLLDVTVEEPLISASELLLKTADVYWACPLCNCKVLWSRIVI